MIFADIPNGSSVFFDANTLIYHFGPHPSLQIPCGELIRRVSRGDLIGMTSSAVLNNVAHRLMTFEATDMYGWPMSGIVYKLQQHPENIKALSKFRQAIDDIPKFGVHVLSVEASHILAAASISQQFGLLSGDALIAAVMQAKGLTNIASNDADFDRVPWITRYAPA